MTNDAFTINAVASVVTQLTDAISCVGITTRTTNANEMTPETAKIAPLWQQFQEKFCHQMDDTTQVYGVYHNYESDVNGEFDVTACIADLSDSQTESISAQTTMVSIPAGNYLVFSQQGEIPQAVIDAWMQVWHYFNAKDCSYTRKYDTDFEKYIGMDTVEVYIAIN